jgi:hypothetical protein
MLRFFPESALVQLEFEKVRELLTAHCRTAWAKDRVAQLRIHTKKEYIDLELNQTNEYKQILQSGQYFPNDFITNIEREIKLLSIPGATLSGEQFILVRRLAENASNIFRWLDAERRTMYPALTTVVHETYYEKAISYILDHSNLNNIWLFSNEPEKAIELLPEWTRKRVRIIPESSMSPAETLQLMRHCHAFVIANSTFSWWGAYLAYNQDSIKIAPKPWFKGEPSPKDIIPESWKTFEAFEELS